MTGGVESPTVRVNVTSTDPVMLELSLAPDGDSVTSYLTLYVYDPDAGGAVRDTMLLPLSPIGLGAGLPQFGAPPASSGQVDGMAPIVAVAALLMLPPAGA